jgi:hypothetical protein
MTELTEPLSGFTQKPPVRSAQLPTSGARRYQYCFRLSYAPNR